MKKLIPLMTLALLVLFGCAKEETTPNAVSTDNQNVGESSVWVINANSDSPVWESVSQDDLQSNSSASATSRSNSAHTHGNFTGGALTITFSGTQNNGGPHGSAEFIQSFGPFTAHVILETYCVSVDGNEAVYGGIVTEVIENNFPPPPPPPPCPNCPPPPPCNPLDIGSYVYFKVVDNGQGNNAPLDQYYGITFATCNGIPCDAGLPWFFGLDEEGNPFDVEGENDKIKVNN